jgi:TonB family protein
MSQSLSPAARVVADDNTLGVRSVKGTCVIQHPRLPIRAILLSLTLISAAAAARAQSPAADPDAFHRRIRRARSLAAAGNLPSARSELESLRASTSDESIREIALVLLMAIYFEQSDFAYAENLLNEAYRARSPQNESATRAYYLLAGQALGGVRAQVDRYREFGLDVSDAGLPEEAVTHLDRLRKLVEQVATQARQVRDESARNIDAAALLENAASARVLLARNESERAQWQREVADVRQRLAGAGPRPNVAAAQSAATTPPAATQAAPQPSPTPLPAQPSPTPAPPAGANAAAARPTPTPAGTTGQPAAAPAVAQPVELGSLVSRATQTVAPVYPSAARSARTSGRVTVFLLIDEKGAVEAVRRTDGPELLKRAAEDAARRWKFRPHTVGNQPARYTGYINFNFEL